MSNLAVVVLHDDPDRPPGWISATSSLRENTYWYHSPNIFVVWEWDKWTGTLFDQYQRKRRIMERMMANK